MEVAGGERRKVLGERGAGAVVGEVEHGFVEMCGEEELRGKS